MPNFIKIASPMKKILLFSNLLVFISIAYSHQLQSSNLPIIVLNTNGKAILDDPKVMADMGIIYNGAGLSNNVLDAYNHYNGKVGIEIRGQSSQQFPMKSYGFELWNSSGASINKSLFGLPEESDWILYAPYNEKTLLHNFLAYTFSRQMGHWASNCRYVELLLNGEYKGIYILMEKIKKSDERVNISKLKRTDISGDAVTGGYIFSIDKQANGWYSAYAAGQGSIQFSYVYPKETNIVAAQKNYLKLYVDSFENALNSNTFQDKINGWRIFADENSFIDYFLVNEVSRNVDGYRLSSFFYKDKASKKGKIFAGPVWDYDLAFRNANYCNGSDTNGWSYQFNTICPADFWQVPFWWNRLMNVTAFQNNLCCRWKLLRQTVFSTANTNALIDSVATLTAQARERHFKQWPVLGQYIWPNPLPIANSYEGELQTLKTWLAARIGWLDKNLPNTGNCANFPVTIETNFLIKNLPNPFNFNNNISIQSAINQPISITITDILGRQMHAKIVNVTAGYTTIPITIPYLTKGIYFLSFTNAAGQKITKKMLQ